MTFENSPNECPECDAPLNGTATKPKGGGLTLILNCPDCPWKDKRDLT